MSPHLPSTALLRLPVCLALLCLAQSGSSATGTDYLPGDLRNRVQQLKLDTASMHTDAINAAARADLTWQWLNAYAVNGGYVPVNATQIIAAVLAMPQPDSELTAALDLIIEELRFRDDHPGGIGTLSAEPGPFVAGELATIRQTYRVGTQPIQTGGAFLVTRHFMTSFDAWQADDPDAPGYISIESDNPRVGFVAGSIPVRGMHGGFRDTRSTLTFRVASGTLMPGDAVTLTYGDKRRGSTGLRMPTFSSDRMPLPLYVAFTEGGPFMSLPIQPIRVTGSTVAGVAGFAPSVVKPGESFKLSIRARDAFYNRATGPVPDWQVRLGNKDWLSQSGTGAIIVVDAKIDEPGIYHPRISSTDGAITGTVNPILVTDEDRPRIYWGDTHGHSGFAEGIGTPERFMIWARDDARLDFVTHSEHDIWLDDAEWETLRNTVREYTTEHEFVAFLGYEWTVQNRLGGHHNVLFRTPEHRARVPAQFFPTLSSLYQGLRARAKTADVVVIPHAHQAGDYRMNDPELEPLIEIMSQHGNFEWFGRMYLQHGHQVGFTAASDNHLSQPGYSAPLGSSLSQRGGLGAVLAAEKTVDAIFDGMRDLAAYATTGDRMILDFSVNGTNMGQRGDFSEERRIAGRVIGTSPVDSVTVVRNGQPIWQRSYLEDASNERNGTFLLTFASDSEPVHPGDNPRGWRTWHGTLEVHNARLAAIEPYDASFPQTANTAPDNPQQVTLATKTRGDTSSFLLRLEGIERTARLQLDLVEERETGGAPPIYRAPARVPASSFSFALRDLESDKLTHTQAVDRYTDTTTLRRIRENGDPVVEFEFVDENQRHGDYYYMRVVQANDAMAWSSPVWVGGHRKR